MAHRTNEEETRNGGPGSISALSSSAIEAWVGLHERTPDVHAGDTTAAARLAATILAEARALRARFSDRMFTFAVEPGVLELQDLLHQTEKNALAAQRHGVESLTARLRNDDENVRDIAARAFDRLDDAAVALQRSLAVADALTGSTGRDNTKVHRITYADPAAELIPPTEPMRRRRPIPESRDQPKHAAGSYPLHAVLPEPERDDQPVEPPVEGEQRKMSTALVRRNTDLVAVDSSSAPGVYSVRQLWRLRLLAAVLVGLVILGLWLLLSDNALTG